MILSRIPIRIVALLLSAAVLPGALLTTVTARSQAPAPAAPSAVTTPAAPHKPRPPKTGMPVYNQNLILLDPGHGGSEDGATLGENSLEKDTTIAFANRLKPLLAAHGFTVILTHDTADDSPSLALDARVELANRSRAVACILIHASPAGHGIHLFTSSLKPPAVADADVNAPKPIAIWGTAQVSTVPQSLRLAGDIANVLYSIRVPLVVTHSSIAPIDEITCPAVAIELAPLASSSGDPTPASDPNYQQRVAEALATALNAWRGHAVPSAAASPVAKPGAAVLPPVKKPKPAPAPKNIPEETPDVVTPRPRPIPAPIVRRAPDAPQPTTAGPSQ